MDHQYLDFMMGYEQGLKDRWSFFVGAGMGIHSWRANEVSTDDKYPVVGGADWTIALSTSARLVLGYRHDSGDEIDVSEPEGGKSTVNLSGGRYSVGFAFNWWNTP